MANCFETAKNALLAIHQYSPALPGEDGAPLDPLLDKLKAAVLVPDPEASAHAGLRQSTISLLYDSSTPPDLIKWLASTDLQNESKITSGRKKVFELLTEHFVRYFKDVKKYAHGLLVQIMSSVTYELGSDSPRIAALRCLRKVMRRLPPKAALTHPDAFSLSDDEVAGLDSVSVEAVWKVLMRELRLGHATRKTKSLSMTEALLKTLGLVAGQYHDKESTEWKQEIHKLVQIATGKLTANFEGDKKNKPEMAVIAGCFACLEHCWRFTDVDGDLLWRCCCISILTLQDSKLHRYEVPAKALRFISRHAEKIVVPSIILSTDAKSKSPRFGKMLPKIRMCSVASASKVKTPGKNAYESCLAALALCANQSLNDPTDELLSITETVISELSSSLEDSTQTSNEVLVTVEVLSAFLACGGVKSISAELKDKLMMQLWLAHDRPVTNNDAVVDAYATDAYGGDAYLPQEKASGWETSSYPLKITSACLKGVCALVTSSQTNCEEGDLTRLDQMMERCFVEYPFAGPTARVMVEKAISFVFQELGSNAVATLLSGAGREAIRRATSRETSSRPQALPHFEESGGPDPRLCWAHSTLWIHLINSDKKANRVLTTSEVLIEQRRASLNSNKEVGGILLGFLLEECLSYVSKLNLSYKREHSGVVSKNPYNHDLLLNLVSFLEATLPNVSAQYFKPWASVLFHGIITRSKELPAVSALYRLMTLALTLSHQSGLFEESDSQVQEPVRAYLAFVSVAASRFSDELLCSALRLLLCPAALAISPPSSSLPSLQLALGKASGHLPTAEVAVSALEHWHEVDMVGLRSHLNELLPLLQPLLFDGAKRGERSDEEQSSKVMGVENSAQLAALQRRIVVFLGRLGGEGKKLVVPADEALGSVLRWEELPPDTLPLFVSFPLSGAQFGELTLQLPELLPRITDICTKEGGDRHSRALAAECLHASILFLVGSAATDASGGAARRYIKLWKRIFHVVPELAVDSEASTRLLFSKLLKQLIHWFSNSSVKEEEATSLLNALSDGIASKDNHALREVCASSMAEFSRYAIKQVSSKTVSQSPIAADRLIARLKNMATHTDHSKRSGAVLAFSHMYKEFREEKSLVSRHSLSLCHAFFISLRRSHADHAALDVSASNAVRDSANIIFKSITKYGDPSRLLKPIQDRGFPICLGELVEWLWNNIGSAEVAFHTQCTVWFYELAPLLSKVSSSASHSLGVKSGGCRAWIEQHESDLILSCLKCFEAPLQDNTSEGATLFGLLSSLDAFIWALNKGVVSAEELFSGSGGIISPSKSKGRKGAEKVQGKGMLSSLAQFATRSLDLLECNDSLNVNYDEWGELRVKVIRRICDLLFLLAPSEVGVSAVLRAGLWDRSLHTLLLKCLLALPSKNKTLPNSLDDCVELNLFFPNAMERLLKKVETYDQSMLRSGSSMQESVAANWASKYWKVCDLRLGHQDTRNVLRSFRLLLKYKLCETISDVTPLTASLQSITEMQEPLDPMVRFDGVAFLQTALDLGWPVCEGNHSLVDAVLDSDTVMISGKSVARGPLLHSRLRGDIDSVLLSPDVFESVARKLLTTASDTSITCFEQLANHMTKKCIANHLVGSQEFLQMSQPHLYHLQCLLQSHVSLDRMLRISEALLRLDARSPLAERLGIRFEPTLLRAVVMALQLSGDINEAIVLKMSALRLIPFFIPGVSQLAPLKVSSTDLGSVALEHKEILDAVEVMVANHFPLRSNEQPKQCALESNYITLLSEVVKVSSSGGTLLLFSKILRELKEGDSHRYASMLHKGLKSLAMKVDVLDGPSVYAALSWALRIVLSEREPPTTRRILFDMLLLPLLKRVPPDRLVSIATENGLLPFGRKEASSDKCLVNNILDLLLTKSEPPPRGLYDYYFKREVAMGMLEQIYDGLPEVSLERNITKSEKFDADLKLNAKLCRYLHGAYSGTSLSAASEEDKEAIIMFKGAAYACLCIVVMATQKQPKLFVNFLWQLKLKEGVKLPWPSVVNLEKTHNFKLFLSRPELKRRGIWPNAFRLANPSPKTASGSGNPQAAFGPSYYGGSYALSQSDISTMLEPNRAADLMGSQQIQDEQDMGVEEDEDGEQTQLSQEQSSQANLTQELEIDRRAVKATDLRDRLGYATLELSDLNRERCMPCLIRSIIKYHELFLAEDEFSPSEAAAAPPLWLPEILKMLQPDQPRNIRLFGLKLLLNDDIRPLCRSWVEMIFTPVLKVAVEELNNQTEGFHTLLQDLCFCLNSPELWECQAFDVNLCSRFISHLLAVSFVASGSQLKQNVSDISALLLRWRPSDLDLRPVADLLETEFKGSGGAKGRAVSSVEGDSSGTISWMKRRLGLQLVSALFAAEYACLSSSCADGLRIAKGIVNSCGFSRKEVYTTAAAVCGDALRTLEGMSIQACIDTQTLGRNISAVLRPLTSAKQLPQLVIVAAKITTVFPSFMTRELCIRLLNHFPHLKSKERMHVLACCNEMQDKHELQMFDYLRPYLPSLLTDSTKFNVGGNAHTAHWIPQVQLSTVRLLMELALDCDVGGLSVVLAPEQPHGVIACTDSPCRELRGYAYELLCKLYTSHPLLNGRKEGGEVLRNACRCALLKGLADPDEDLEDDSALNDDDEDDDDNVVTGYTDRGTVSIRKMMFSYWSNSAAYKGIKENGVVGVMDRLLNELWDPSIADHWVHFATYLLLDQSSLSPSYETKNFRVSLGDCAFHRLKLDTSVLNSAYGSMVPKLSLESQIIQSQSQDSSFVMPSVLSDDYTQMGNGFIKATMDKVWSMTQQGNAMDIYGEGTQDTTVAGESTIQAGSFTIGKTSMPAPSRRRVSEKSRFYSSQVEAQRRRNMSNQASSSARKRKVSLLRSYRDGELPDIQAVSVSEILRPLQALILKDAPLARIAFSWLFTEVFQIQSENRGAQRAMGEVLERMLKQASQQTDLVGCLLAAARRIVSQPQQRDEFHLNAVIVADASLRSLNYHSGILLLEEILLLRMNANAHADQHYDEANEGEWLQLSRLYAALNEKDVLLGLSKRSAKHEETREALKLEQAGYVNKAIGVYNYLISKQAECDKNMHDDEWQSASEAESTTWKQRSISCCRALGQWTDIKTALIEEAGSVENLWGEAYKDWALPYYVRSLVAEPSLNTELKDFLENSSSVNGRREWLERRLTCDISMAAALDRDWSRLSHYATLGFRQFLSSWAGLHPCATAARKLALGDLQRLVELEDLSECANASLTGGTVLSDKVVKLLSIWERQQPDMQDAPAVWSDLATDRSIGLRTLLQHLTPIINSDREVYNLKQLLDKHLASVHFSAATAAVRHGHKQTAKLHIQTATNLMMTCQHSDPTLRMARMRAVCAYNLPSSDHKKSKQMVSIEKSRVHIEEVALELREESEPIKEEIALYQGKWAEMYYDLLNGSDDRDALVSSVSDALTAYGRCGENAAAHLAMASLCDKLILNWEEKVPTEHSAKKGKSSSGPFPHQPDVDAGDVASMIITHTFQALKLGGKGAEAAAFTIPRLLQLLRRHPSCTATFKEVCLTAPTWPFLRWTSQLCALLDRTGEGDAVVPLLERMAREYPQALRHPYQISVQSLTQPTNQPNDAERVKAMQARTSTLSLLVQDDTTEDFVQSLKGLQNPELWLKDVLRAVAKKCSDKESNRQVLNDTIRSEYLEVYHLLFNNAMKPGATLLKFRTKPWQNDLDKVFGKKGEKIDSASKPFREAVGKIYSSVASASQAIKHGKGSLSDFSPWLSSYDGSTASDHALEVPGQYWCPSVRPDPSSHARIASFDSEVLTMGSIRKPKRLTILGDDEKERSYLVKGGEDLRNDERIEQLLTLMNGILHKDGPCAGAGLKVRTYAVIPLTTDIGLLEWVPNTIPIKGFLDDGIEKIAQANKSARKKNITQVASPFSLHAQYLKMTHKKGNRPEDYSDNFKDVPAAKVVPGYQNLVKSVPWDLLRRQLMSMASAPEVFLTCRNEFARSFAVWSMACYVLGIGDRHLDNFLIDKHSGQIVPIDFGMAFGMGASELPTPELIPFRLTPQFTNLLRPLDSVGLLSHHCVLAMKAFRVEASVLLRTMDVFLQDPIVDWIQSCSKKREDEGDEEEGNGRKTKSTVIWEPRRRIRNAERKLKGFNPMEILIDDLSKNATMQKHKAIAALTGIIKGQSVGNQIPERVKSAALQEEYLSISDQVTCLIDMATDPNILGRQYVGLASWV